MNNLSINRRTRLSGAGNEMIAFICSTILIFSCSVPSPDNGGVAFDGVIRVREYGAVPDDGLCDIDAIAEAVRAAAAKKASVIEFEEGIYDLFVGDASLRNAIEIQSIDNLSLRGAVNRKGEPATVFLRHYDMAKDINGKQILLVKDCNCFTLENVRFDNTPQYMASGKVYHNDGTVVGIRLLDGVTAPEESLMYCTNVWNSVTEELRHVESVTYMDDVNRSPADYLAKSTGDGTVMVRSAAIASRVEVGDGISWHFGSSGLQVDFRFCDNLTVNNVESNSAIGFHMQASYCRNISSSGVKIRRRGANYAVGSRDGWKLYLCSGKVEIDKFYCEGVRWDGQNVHGKLLFPKERLNNFQMRFSYHGAEIERIIPGDRIGFWQDRSTEILLTVARYEYTPNSPDRICTVTFNERIPDFVNSKTVCNVYSHTIAYTLRGSEFRNIAGCAAIIRSDNSTISGNTFHNIMYPAICIGGDLDNEGVTSRNAVIEDNLLTDCGWVARGPRKGAISVGLSNVVEISPYIRNITIRNNSISGSPVGIHVYGVDGLTISGNSISSCGTDIITDDVLNSKR